VPGEVLGVVLDPSQERRPSRVLPAGGQPHEVQAGQCGDATLMREAAVLVEHVVSEEPGHCSECGTVLVRTGETIDILLDITNVGLWVAHYHIAEHHESAMMFSFEVDE
jgi:hypothetical protein